MSLPQVVSREEWLVARRRLLEQEKELTRRRDALNTERRRPDGGDRQGLPVRGPGGEARLVDLFEGRRQLIVGHFMFDPEWEDGCPSCSAGADEVSKGLLEHLHARDTTLAYVSRAPLDKIERYKARKGWIFPWFSLAGQRLQLRLPRDARRVGRSLEYNYRTKAEHQRAGTSYFVEAEQPIEMPGSSYFLRDGESVFHTTRRMPAAAPR